MQFSAVGIHNIRFITIGVCYREITLIYFDAAKENVVIANAILQPFFAGYKRLICRL